MAPRVAWVGAASVVLLGVAGACRQLVGIGDEPPAAGSDAGAEAAPACGIAYSGDTCEACLEQHCCDQAAACADGAACSALHACMGGCGGDPTCRAKCTFDHLGGPDPLDTQLTACLAGQCHAACNIDCGGFASFFGPDAAAACQKCLVANACQLGQDCASDPSCLGNRLCSLTNHVLDRDQACQAPFASGEDAGVALFTALQASCPQCPLGDQWYCVGHAGQPPAASGPTAVTVHLYDQLKKTSVAGVTVQSCSAEAPPCSAYGTTTSDDAGMATVTFPPPGQGPGPTGFLYLTGPGLVPELSYWGYPLSETSLSFDQPVVTSQELAAAPLLLGVPIDPGRAIISVVVLDCDVAFAPGVRVSVDPSDSATKVFYARGDTIEPTATRTDTTGVALVVNVLPGSVKVTATPDGLGGAQPSSEVQVLAIADAGTGAALYVNK